MSTFIAGVMFGAFSGCCVAAAAISKAREYRRRWREALALVERMDGRLSIRDGVTAKDKRLAAALIAHRRRST